ncbi:NAD(P)H-dependent oxidoreductase, partial [Flavobacteriales bacterium]|nr:NAD(P)H-dependent oxidoreductase [Flavobacteriales bacterium]
SEIIDARNFQLNPYHSIQSEELVHLENKISQTDNLIIAMGVHNYSINDSLKIILDNCFKNVEGKFFGILCAAGGDKSYLSTMHLTQICMNEWKMIQLPRIVYASSKDFNNNSLKSKEVKDWMMLFCNEFTSIGKKLMS